MESYWSAPAAFNRNLLKSIATSALQQFGDYGLRTNQIWQRLGDQLFDYELGFTLFNNQAQIRFGSERLSVNIQNARVQREVQVVHDCLVRATKCVESGVISRNSIQVLSHASFQNEESCRAFFDPFVETANSIVGGGRVIVVQEKDWSAPVRLLVEKSLAFQNAVFLVWSGEYVGFAKLEYFQGIGDTFNKSAQKLGLEIWFE